MAGPGTTEPLHVQILWQPIVDLRTRAPVGFEALGRVEGIPDIGAALSRRDSQTLALDMSLCAVALKTAASLPPGTKLFVNLADVTVQTATLSLRPLPRREGIVWELPESRTWSVGSPDQARRFFGEYALDNVGAGNADLDRVRMLKPPWIKIARELVRGCDRDPGRQEAIRAVVWLARRTGSSVVAKGVETEAEATCAARLGVGYAQGFLFGRPVPPEQASRLTPGA